MVLWVWKKLDTGINSCCQGEELGWCCQEQQGNKGVKLYYLSFPLGRPSPLAAFNRESVSLLYSQGRMQKGEFGFERQLNNRHSSSMWLLSIHIHPYTYASGCYSNNFMLLSNKIQLSFIQMKTFLLFPQRRNWVPVVIVHPWVMIKVFISGQCLLLIQLLYSPIVSTA